MTEDIEKAFVSYLLQTFEEDFDDTSVRHLTFLALFEAGWGAREDRLVSTFLNKYDGL